MPSYQVTLSEGGSPNCAGVYTEHILYNGQMSYRCVNDAGTWYLSWQGVSWYISQHLPPTLVDAYWLSSLPDITGDYAAGPYATGTATVAEYVPPVAAVVTNILLGSTPEACSILNSRIVRGPL